MNSDFQGLADKEEAKLLQGHAGEAGEYHTTFSFGALGNLPREVGPVQHVALHVQELTAH